MRIETTAEHLKDAIAVRTDFFDARSSVPTHTIVQQVAIDAAGVMENAIKERLIAWGWTPPAQDTSGDRYVAGFREGRESLHELLQELAPALPPALREKVERVLR